MGPVEAEDGLRVVGYNLPPRIGYRVKLTKQGEQSFDEVYHKISGDREGTITDVKEDGQVCMVRWAPEEGEHQYRTGKFGRFELYCAADMERRMSSPFDRELLRSGTTSDEPSPGRSLESLFAEDYNNNVLPSEVTDSLQASTVPSARDTTARPNAGSLQPTFTETAASQANNSRARYKNPLNRSSLSQIETISLTGSISNGNAKTPPQEPSSKPPVKKLTIVESPERCRPAVQFGAGSPEINAENSPDTAQPGERSKPQSLVSMVVKNPLRQGLEWAESSKSSEEQAYPQSQTDPSLMTLLVKRPLRLGLELADTMTDQAKEDQQTSPSLISHVIKQPIRNSGLVLPEEASEGNKDPSLLTIVIKRPLQQFVWGPAGAEASKDADDQRSTQDMETGVEQDDEHWNFGVPTRKDESKDATGTENIQDQPIPAVEGKSGDGTEEIVNDGLAKIEEDVEYDPDTMMPVKKDLLAQADDEEEMELDPDTLMPIPKKKANQLQAAKLPNFTSFRARKLIGANTKPPTARLITASVNGEADELENFDDTASVFSSSTRVSEASLRAQLYAIPKNEELSPDLTKTFENVRKLNSSSYSPGNKLMGGLDSFEGHLRANRRPTDAVKASKAKELKGADQVEEIVQGVSNFFKSHRNTEW